MNKIVVPICITMMVLGFFYVAVQSDRASREAEAKIAVACVESGGSWLNVNGFGGPYCERAKP